MLTESRHLGLLDADEVENLQENNLLAETLQDIDLKNFYTSEGRRARKCRKPCKVAERSSQLRCVAAKPIPLLQR